MAQEFYIDENGNKIPLNGTVTSADMLPIEAGSSKMTSEAIDEVNEKATSEVIPLEVAQGVNFAYASVSKNDKLVTITAEVRFSGGANTWTNLATIAYPPRVVQLSTPAINSANGSLMGILQVQSSGNIRIYPTTAQNNGACAFSISYLTA